MICDEQMMEELLYCVIAQGFYNDMYFDMFDKIGIDFDTYLTLLEIVGGEIGETIEYKRD